MWGERLPAEMTQQPGQRKEWAPVSCLPGQESDPTVFADGLIPF